MLLAAAVLAIFKPAGLTGRKRRDGRKSWDSSFARMSFAVRWTLAWRHCFSGAAWRFPWRCRDSGQHVHGGERKNGHDQQAAIVAARHPPVCGVVPGMKPPSKYFSEVHSEPQEMRRMEPLLPVGFEATRVTMPDDA